LNLAAEVEILYDTKDNPVFLSLEGKGLR